MSQYEGSSTVTPDIRKKQEDFMSSNEALQICYIAIALYGKTLLRTQVRSSRVSPHDTDVQRTLTGSLFCASASERFLFSGSRVQIALSDLL